jgi:hypothetical protein
MKVVHKFSLEVNDELQTLRLPALARVVHCGIQDDVIRLWIEYPYPSEASISRHFRVFGTGQGITDDMTWVGTVQAPPFVWHVYEVAK